MSLREMLSRDSGSIQGKREGRKSIRGETAAGRSIGRKLDDNRLPAPLLMAERPCNLPIGRYFRDLEFRPPPTGPIGAPLADEFLVLRGTIAVVRHRRITVGGRAAAASTASGQRNRKEYTRRTSRKEFCFWTHGH